MLFISFGVFGFIPTCHYIYRFGVKHAFTGMINDFFVCNQYDWFFISAGATQYLLLVAALYGIGACIYAGKIQKKRILLIKLMF